MLEMLKSTLDRIVHFHCTTSVVKAVGRNMELSSALLSELSLADLDKVAGLNSGPHKLNKEP